MGLIAVVDVIAVVIAVVGLIAVSQHLKCLA